MHAHPPYPPIVSDRHARQLRLPGFGEAQQAALRHARVLVVGAGGLGSPILEYLTAVGIGTIGVIDIDRVDVTNLHRQIIHSTHDVGDPKVVSAARRMRALDPAVVVHPINDALTVDNALDLIADYDLVIDGTDNFPTRYLVSDACEILNKPVVWGSILAYAGQVSVFFHDDGRGPTYRDVHPVPPKPGDVPSCAEAGVLGMLCGIIGTTMALEAVKVITGIGESLHGRIALFDALTARWAEVPVRRNPERPPVIELEDLVITCGLPGVQGTGAEISAQEAVQRYGLNGDARPVRLIDVREPHETAAGVVVGAECIPLGRITAQPDAYASLEGAVVYCASGVRSATAQNVLASAGVSVTSVAGGIEALAQAGAVIDAPAIDPPGD